MSKSKVLVAQLGARRHYQQPLIFHQWDILDTLYTDFYAGNKKIIQFARHFLISKYLPNIIKKAFDRYEPALERAKIIDFPYFGYECIHKLKKANCKDLSSTYIWSGQEFCQKILQKGLNNANVIYGFNGASLELFKYAKSKGIRCVLDQTIAERSLVYKLLLQEEKLLPEWSFSPLTISDADIELIEREKEEQKLADHIVCGSQFVKDSLIATGIEANKISVVSLGRSKESKSSEIYKTVSQRRTAKKRGDGLRILFAGTVGLRKGIPYLLKALKQLKGEIPFTCKVAGTIAIQPKRLNQYRDVCEFMGQVPRSMMSELYAWADVFVLPSICEGSAMVTYEALNWCLPVITTYNSGSIAQDEVDDFIVPIRTPNKIAQTLMKIYSDEHQVNLNQRKEYLSISQQKAKNILRQAINY